MVFTNLRRQLEAPRLARSGQGYGLRVLARGDSASPLDVAVAFLSSAAADLALPGIGILGIDPLAAIALPPVVIPRPARSVAMTVDLPQVPALAGTPLRAQAVILRGPGEVPLTNVTYDVFLR